jgi:hypothetical protein
VATSENFASKEVLENCSQFLNLPTQDRFGSLGCPKASALSTRCARTGKTTASVRARERVSPTSTYTWHQHQDRAYHPTLTQTIGAPPSPRYGTSECHNDTESPPPPTLYRRMSSGRRWRSSAKNSSLTRRLAHVRGRGRGRPLHQHSRRPPSMRTRISTSDSRQTRHRKTRCSRCWESWSFGLGKAAGHAVSGE